MHEPESKCDEIDYETDKEHVTNSNQLMLQDLQETLEFEIFGPSGSMESKSTEADDIESKSHT